MKKRDIPESTCAFCERASRLIDEESCLCKKRGVVAMDFSCKSFVYDPLKENVTPRRAKITIKEL